MRHQQLFPMNGLKVIAKKTVFWAILGKMSQKTCFYHNFLTVHRKELPIAAL
jgi:hypothetical protein